MSTKNKLTDEEKIEAMNEILATSLDTEPLTEFKEPLSTVDAEMRYGLAILYGNKGARKYLEDAILKALRDIAVKSTTPVDIAFGKARALTLKELLIKSRRAFEEVEKLQRK